eukprot:gnl/MRDRNA2_/MRDRNA2_67547_c0_seq1.p1 gnl/MRDRNA2_/MRDRNA2_67547_c0~~gnl/MRDRNA2_/MRDRNA2_67547_c0_seq1.p1  ORF type:complete len:100 (+),score=0.77 gnl/MRDRNA2_/MRDRNA2_67547_c0_seq1:531-830(+)
MTPMSVEGKLVLECFAANAKTTTYVTWKVPAIILYGILYRHSHLWFSRDAYHFLRTRIRALLSVAICMCVNAKTSVHCGTVNNTSDIISEMLSCAPSQC